MTEIGNAKWAATTVQSPSIKSPVEIIAAKDILYVPNGHRYQTFNIYLPNTADTSNLIGASVTSLPTAATTPSKLPQWHVHIHGGAWRHPQLHASSIEAEVAHAFSSGPASPISAVISLNYTLSPFPSHPTLPYDPVPNHHSDPSREALHPAHVHDILRALAFLHHSLGLVDDSYILSGHSAGACLTFQALLPAPQHYGFAEKEFVTLPKPAALLGTNGLYDLPALVHALGPSHAALREVYLDLLSIAFGADQEGWIAASPAMVGREVIAARVRGGRVPGLVVLDQSDGDQLVPMNQVEALERRLGSVEGVTVVRGTRCKGKHAAPWEEGYMLWENVLDVLRLLEVEGGK